MCQHAFSCNITDCINAGNRCFHFFINGDTLPGVGNTHLSQFFRIKNRRASGRNQNFFRTKNCLFALALDRNFETIEPSFDFFDHSASHSLDKLFAQGQPHAFLDIGIAKRQDVRRHFDDRYFAAETCVNTCKLHANGASTYNDKALRDLA